MAIYTYVIPYPGDYVMLRLHYLRWRIKWEINGCMPEVNHSDQEMIDDAYYITITCEFSRTLSMSEQNKVRSVVENSDTWTEIDPVHSTEIPIDDAIIDALLVSQFPEKTLMYIGKTNTYRICGKDQLTDEELQQLNSLIISTIIRKN